jgi:hypothetical protein
MTKQESTVNIGQIYRATIVNIGTPTDTTGSPQAACIPRHHEVPLLGIGCETPDLQS